MITVFVNEKAGRAAELRDAIERGGALAARPVEPSALADAIDEVVESGSSRVVVAGGDGTLATAAAALAGSAVELAVIPGGTLNHFAGDLGVPTDLGDACDLAARGTATTEVDLGRVNGRVVLNTSSVGAYTRFVREREQLERRFPYRIASLVAGFRVLRNLRPVRVEIEVNGEMITYHTPLLFIGVGEREVRIPMLGSRVRDGARGLHVLIVRRRGAFGLLASALLGILRGVREISRARHVDAFIVNRCVVHLHRRSVVAVDGELVTLDSPLEYSIERGALRVVVPADAG